MSDMITTTEGAEGVDDADGVQETDQIRSLRARRAGLQAQYDQALAAYQARLATFQQAQEAQVGRTNEIAVRAARANELARANVRATASAASAEPIAAGDSDADDELLHDATALLIQRQAERAAAALGELEAEVAAARAPVLALNAQIGLAELQLEQAFQVQRAQRLVAEYAAQLAQLQELAQRMRQHNRAAIMTARSFYHARTPGLKPELADSQYRGMASDALALPGATEAYQQQGQNLDQHVVYAGMAVVLASDLTVVTTDEDVLFAARPTFGAPGAIAGGYPSGPTR